MDHGPWTDGRAGETAQTRGRTHGGMDLVAWHGGIVERGNRRLNFNLSLGAGPQFPRQLPRQLKPTASQSRPNAVGDKRGTWDGGADAGRYRPVPGLGWVFPSSVCQPRVTIYTVSPFCSPQTHPRTKQAMVPSRFRCKPASFGPDPLAWWGPPAFWQGASARTTLKNPARLQAPRLPAAVFGVLRSRCSPVAWRCGPGDVESSTDKHISAQLAPQAPRVPTLGQASIRSIFGDEGEFKLNP